MKLTARQVHRLLAALVTGLSTAVTVDLATGVWEKVALVLIAVIGAYGVAAPPRRRPSGE